jgi:hypothetical protein
MNNFTVLIGERTEIKFQIFQRIMRLGVVQATGYFIQEGEEKTKRMQQSSMKQSPS